MIKALSGEKGIKKKNTLITGKMFPNCELVREIGDQKHILRYKMAQIYMILSFYK